MVAMEEEAFMDAYRLLINNKDEVNNILNEIIKLSRENSFESEIKELNEKIVADTNKKEKLLELMIEGAIDRETYDNKLQKYNNKIEKNEMKMDSLKAEVKNDNSIENGINKLKQLIVSKDEINEFDPEIFDAIVDYAIIGGYAENGQIDPYMIRFICKSKFSLTSSDDVTKEEVINNAHIARSQFDVILDFENRQSIFMFEKDEDGHNYKKIIDKIRVRVELKK